LIAKISNLIYANGMFRTAVESEPRAFVTLFRICIIHTRQYYENDAV